MTADPHSPPDGRLPLPVTLMLLACIGLIIGSAASLWLSLSDLERSAANVNQTWATIGQLRVMRATLALAENGQRGYLLDGKTEHVQALDANARSFAAALTQVTALLKRREDQAQHLAALGTLAGIKQAEFASTLTLQAAGQRDAALRLARDSDGRQVTERTLETLLDMIALEHERLAEFNVHAYDRFRTATAVGVIIGAITLGVLVVFYGLIARNLRRSQSAEAGLIEANQMLESRIAQRTAQLSNLSRHLLEIGEREKAALARELHDELGSNLTAINLDIASAARQLADINPQAHARLTRAMQVLKDTVDVKRRIILGLHPTTLDTLGLVAALQMHVEDFSRRTGLRCEPELPATLDELDQATAIALYRVVQEALTNIAKYARATTVELSLRRVADALELRVADDGVGIAADALEQPLAHGLIGMRERVARLGGTLQIRPGPQGGTVVVARVPLVAALSDQIDTQPVPPTSA